MKHILLIGFSLFPYLLPAQQSITLEQCRQAAEDNFPLNEQSAYLQDITDAQLLKINALWQPKLYLNAQATYQSDVTGIPISFPGIEIPELSKDQYKASIDFNQVLYDGGATAQQKAVANEQLLVEQQKVTVDRYKVIDKVNQLYMAVLMANIRMEMATVTLAEIGNYKALAEVSRQYGTASDMQVLEFQSEMMKLEQQIIEIRHLRLAAIEGLKVLTGLQIDEYASFTTPSAELITTTIARPELELFSRQRAVFELQRNFAEAPNQPTISLFAQGGYGRPGLNMLVDSFAFYYIGGIKLSYPLWTGNTRKRDASIYAANSAITTLQELQFRQSINLQTAQYQQDIIKLEQQIAVDDSIVVLRNMLFQGATVQFEQGAVSTREVIAYLHDHKDAMLARSIHELQLLATKVNYLNTLGQH